MKDADLTPVDLAQKNYCLSLAYIALVYPTKSISHAEKALANITQQDQPWLYHKVQIVHAEALDSNATPGLGLELANNAVAWALAQGDEQIEMYALRIRGLIKTSLGDYLGALQDLNTSYSIASQKSDADKIAIGLYLGLVYEYRDEFSLALPYFQQAVNFYRGSGDESKLSVALYGLGYAHSKQGEYSLARETLLESLKWAKAISDTQGEAYAIKELAYINIQQDNLARADQQLSEVAALVEDSDNPFLFIAIKRLHADLNLAKGNTIKAEQAILQASEMVNKDAMPVLYLELEQQKAELMAGRGYYKDAYEKTTEILKQKLTLMREQSTTQLLQIRAQYELETKVKENQHLQSVNDTAEAELKTQRSRNVLLLLLLALVCVICLLLAYIVLRNQEVQKRLELMANLDSLTGVPNRRRTMELIDNQLSLSRRHDYPLAVGIIDLDHFKDINDNYGHPAGDRVLEAFGHLLSKNIRATDIVGRIGGEEFIVALPHTSTETAYNVIDQLRIKAHNIPGLINDNRFAVSFSCGLCSASALTNLSDLMACADSALYIAKQSGRDCIVISDGTIQRVSSTVRASD